MPDRIKPGDRLFWNLNLIEWNPVEVTIGKVSRKWAEFDPPEKYQRGARINVQTLELDGRYVYGKLYWSQDDWQRQRDDEQAQMQAQEAWDELRSRMSYTRQCPKVLTAAYIRDVFKVMLGDA